MGKIIYKYNITIGEQVICLPKGYKILKVGQDYKEKLAIWALVDEESKEQEKVTVVALGTGWHIPAKVIEEFDFIDTIIEKCGLTWHVFAAAGDRPLM